MSLRKQLVWAWRANAPRTGGGVGLLIGCLLASLGLVGQSVHGAAPHLAEWLLVIGCAGIAAWLLLGAILQGAKHADDPLARV
jgi:hypothetical protein